MLNLNDHYVMFYLGKEVRPVRGATLKMIIEHAWGAGICKEQAIIDCMHQGFALCVTEPAVERIWAWWDNSYAEYCKTQESKQTAEVKPL